MQESVTLKKVPLKKTQPDGQKLLSDAFQSLLRIAFHVSELNISIIFYSVKAEFRFYYTKMTVIG